jgi:hypothetical protein
MISMISVKDEHDRMEKHVRIIFAENSLIRDSSCIFVHDANF